jgi:hypothetical protein
LVLVDHATEDPLAVDRSAEWDDGRRVVVGWAVPAALMRPMIVEVSGVLVEDVCGVAFVVDEDPVRALGPDAADEPFGVAVGSWCLRRDLDRRDALGGEHGIEGCAVLGVPVADEEPERRESVVEVCGVPKLGCTALTCRLGSTFVLAD